MRNPVYVVSGATGFIGRALIEELSSRNIPIRALVRRIPAEKVSGVTYFEFDIEGEVPAEVFSGATVFIHAAYVKERAGEDSRRINKEGTERLLAAARGCGVERSLFFSSLSARADALSSYGKSKFEIEKLFFESGDLVLRPGLVLGNGGLFLTVKNMIRQSWIVPLIGGGWQPMQTVHIDDLLNASLVALDGKKSGLFHVAESEASPIRDLYFAVAKKVRKRTWFVPVPIWCALLLLHLVRFLPISLPITRDNLLGLMRSAPCEVSKDLEALGVTVRNYSASLEGLLR